jgi:hypothetical protein
MNSIVYGFSRRYNLDFRRITGVFYPCPDERTREEKKQRSAQRLTGWGKGDILLFQSAPTAKRMKK